MGADLYSGVAGTGKSYHVAQVIYEKLRNGINIISNVDIDITKIPPKGNKPLGQYIFVSNKQWLSNSIRVKSKFVCKFIFQLCGFIYATFIFKRFD